MAATRQARLTKAQAEAAEIEAARTGRVGPFVQGQVIQGRVLVRPVVGAAVPAWVVLHEDDDPVVEYVLTETKLRQMQNQRSA